MHTNLNALGVKAEKLKLLDYSPRLLVLDCLGPSADNRMALVERKCVQFGDNGFRVQSIVSIGRPIAKNELQDGGKHALTEVMHRIQRTAIELIDARESAKDEVVAQFKFGKLFG